MCFHNDGSLVVNGCSDSGVVTTVYCVYPRCSGRIVSYWSRVNVGMPFASIAIGVEEMGREEDVRGEGGGGDEVGCNCSNSSSKCGGKGTPQEWRRAMYGLTGGMMRRWWVCIKKTGNKPKDCIFIKKGQDHGDRHSMNREKGTGHATPHYEIGH